MVGLDIVGLGRLTMTKRELKRMNEERWAREKEQRDAKWAEELALRRARGQAVTQPPPPQSQASTSKKGKVR